MTNEERMAALISCLDDAEAQGYARGLDDAASIPIALAALTEAEARGYARGIEAAALVASVVPANGHAISCKIRALAEGKSE